MSEAVSVPKRPVGLWTKCTYGFGAAAYGIKNNGFDYFFLIFCNISIFPVTKFFITEIII